ENTPGNKLDPAELLAKGKHVLFGVPGAFTTGCSNTHLPGYVASYDAWKAKGIDTINCVAVNDAFVMAAWGKAGSASGKIRMLADPAGEYVTSMGLNVHAAGLGGKRSKRFAMVIEDGKVTHLQIEPDGFGLTCSLADSLLENV
ncbi:MAG: peroxiredoxin, partial [Myxococcota bacterium]|nr:peroxiredoxin [Myxococcota bacterium]